MALRHLIAAALAIVLIDPQVGFAGSPSAKEPTAVGRDGAAATVDALGTAAAIDTLRRGGGSAAVVTERP